MYDVIRVVNRFAKKVLGKVIFVLDKSISRRITLSFVPLIVIVTMTISFISYYKYSDSLQKQIISDTSKMIDQVSNNIDFYFKDIMTPMAMISRNTYVLKALKDYNGMDAKERLFIERDITSFTRNINIFKSYIGDVIIVGKNGFVINLQNSPSLVYDYNFFTAEWMNIKNSEEVGLYFTSPHKCDYYYENSRPYKMTISAILPIKEERNLIGYVICDINLNALNKNFDSLNISKNGYIYMIDSEGKLVFHPNSDLIGSLAQEDIKNNVSKKTNGSFRYKKGKIDSLIIHSTSPNTGWILVAEVPFEEIIRPSLEVFKVILIVLLVSIIITILISFIISLRIKKPLNDLIKRMNEVGEQDFSNYDRDFGYGEIAFLRIKFEKMVSKINILINDVYISKMRQQEAEFKALQSQINPHFFYNALQLLKAEAIFSGNKEISSIVTSIGYLLRYTMNTRNEIVKISDEINYVKNYIEIYKRRFEDRFNYSIYVEEKIQEYEIPKLILQPIVENAIKHGLKDKKCNGIINININQVNNYINFEVFDNGNGISKEQVKNILLNIDVNSDAKSIGLRNVNSRLKLKYGQDVGINILSKENQYTKITFHIPLCMKENNYV